ncbi:methyl-accepting chemotaxis protein [Idiomarina abyssalis]|uniref:methyl-accepting chemotaxis protein n=1 Tax=Idiomarina abyssalis TaxID=86102 RepID=UPI001CD4207C|nr:methyl-accepting chemotaxis protein [Idiomarina abyssalis]
MLRQLTIGARASVAFGIIGLLVLALGIFSLNRLMAVSGEMDVVVDQRIPALQQVNDVDRNFLRVRIHAANIAANLNEPNILMGYRARFESAQADLREVQKQLDDTVKDPDVREAFNDYMKLDAKYWDLTAQVEENITSNNDKRASELRENQILPLTNQISDSLNRLLVAQEEAVQDSSDRATSVAAFAEIAVVVVLVVVVLLLALFAVVLTRSIVTPISAAVDFAETIAQRNLTQTIEIIGKDEPAKLLRQLERTQKELRNSVSTISESSEQLASTSEELSSVTEESTRTIQQQSEELEQAATAVNELTTAVETVAQDAQNASEASDEANQQAQHGNDRVRQTVRAIEELSQEIGDSSGSVTELAEKVKSITKVLEVIRGIAEQTNLLALNAAIEAARAGESGRGFAVVADEVRSLAHKTQQSTVEIEDMVKAINESSDRSVATMDRSLERATKTLDVAREAGEALQLIATAVSEINNHNTSIASAAEEQANVSRDVDKNLVSIRDLSNSTASGAEQTSASSRELSRLAVDLNELVKRFRI